MLKRSEHLITKWYSVENCWRFTPHRFLLYQNYLRALANLLHCVFCFRNWLIAHITDVMRVKIIWDLVVQTMQKSIKEFPLLLARYNRIFALSFRRIGSWIPLRGIFLLTYRNNCSEEMWDCEVWHFLRRLQVHALCCQSERVTERDRIPWKTQLGYTPQTLRYTVTYWPLRSVSFLLPLSATEFIQ